MDRQYGVYRFTSRFIEDLKQGFGGYELARTARASRFVRSGRLGEELHPGSGEFDPSGPAPALTGQRFRNSLY
jgi:hypothetical protein